MQLSSTHRTRCCVPFNSGHTNAPQCYVIRTLAIWFFKKQIPTANLYLKLILTQLFEELIQADKKIKEN